MATISKLYTMQEASQHNTKDDCWVVIDGKSYGAAPSLDVVSVGVYRRDVGGAVIFVHWVYDVSSYLDDHPGGDDVIIAATGIDATDEFEDAGHSKSARDLMENFFIGELDTSTPVSSEKPVIDDFQGFFHLTKKHWAVPVAVVGISVAVGFLYLRKK